MNAVRLRHVAQINPPTPKFDLLADDEPVTFLPLEAVWPGAGLDISRTRSKGEVSSGYTRFRESDVLVPKITPTFEANRSTIARGLRRDIGTGTTELHILRPGPHLDERYANYLLSSRPFLQGGEAAMKGVAGQQRVPDEWLRDFHVPVPEKAQQQAIADFLDAETARIDALITKKRRLAALVEARFSRAVEVEVEHLIEEHGTIPLKRLTTVTVGIVIQPARWYVEEGGVVALRGINVRPGHLDLKDLVRISEEGHRANAKSLLREGDLVVVRTGDAGATVVVPPSLGGANCIDLLVIHKSPDLDSEFLRFVMNSGWSKEQIIRGSVGTIQSHFNVESLRELPVPSAPLDVQRNLRQRLDTESARVIRIVSNLRRQLALLNEHRQAFITAAVTGQIEVSGVAAR